MKKDLAFVTVVFLLSGLLLAQEPSIVFPAMTIAPQKTAAPAKPIILGTFGDVTVAPRFPNLGVVKTGVIEPNPGWRVAPRRNFELKLRPLCPRYEDRMRNPDCRN